MRRPAIYELKGETTAGAAAAARRRADAGSRSDGSRRWSASTSSARASPSTSIWRAQPAGRSRCAAATRCAFRRSVRCWRTRSSVSGHVHRPGEYQFQPGHAHRRRDAEPRRAQAERRPALHAGPARAAARSPRARVLRGSRARAGASRRPPANFELAPRDQIYVFDLESGRDRIIEPLMRELRMQSRIDEPTARSERRGQGQGARASIRSSPACASATCCAPAAASTRPRTAAQAELTRYEVVNGESRQAELIEIDLRQVLAGDPAADMPLQPFDYLVIKEVPLWAAQEEVEIRGEVQIPRALSDSSRRDAALGDGARRRPDRSRFRRRRGVHARGAEGAREASSCETLATRMESDVAQFSLMTAQETGKDASSGAGRRPVAAREHAQCQAGRTAGHRSGSLDGSAQPGSEQDIVLKDGDRLLVPRVTQEVTVHRRSAERDFASVSRRPGARRLHRNERRPDAARRRRSHLRRARGRQRRDPLGNAWFSSGVDIQTGDTIVAPLDTERMRPLPFWTAVTTIIYNLAIAAAAINSF